MSETMRAVRYDGFGGIDVLEVREVPRPVPGPEQVLVAVRAAGINPGEALIRSGGLAQVYPSTFPSGQGSDLAGTVVEVGPGVTGWSPGAEVIGFVHDRSSHAELAVVPADHLLTRPDGVSVEQGGALHVAGSTAWAAVRAIDPRPGETVLVSAAAGGVGTLAVQLLVERGATVIGLAGPENHDWLAAHGVVPLDHHGGDRELLDKAIRAAAPAGVQAVLDAFGQGYVALALDLGVPAHRINTIIDFAAAQEFGTLSAGNAEGANVADLTALAERIAAGRLELPIAARHPLADVRDAYRGLERRHTRGKIVLIP